MRATIVQTSNCNSASVPHSPSSTFAFQQTYMSIATDGMAVRAVLTMEQWRKIDFQLLDVSKNRTVNRAISIESKFVTVMFSLLIIGKR